MAIHTVGKDPLVPNGSAAGVDVLYHTASRAPIVACTYMYDSMGDRKVI